MPRLTPGPRPGLANLPEVVEEGCDVTAEQVGLLGGWEVAAAGHGRPPADVVQTFGPLAGRRAIVDELVEDSNRRRHRYHVGQAQQELGEATRPAIGQDQRDSAAAAGTLMHKMHPDTIDLGPEVTEPVQPAFLRAPVEAVGPVPQQASQVAEICALPPWLTRCRPRPPRVPDPRTQVSEGLLPHPDTELLCPEGSHPASLARCTGMSEIRLRRREAERFGVRPPVMLGQHFAGLAGLVRDGAVADLAARDRKVRNRHGEAAGA